MKLVAYLRVSSETQLDGYGLDVQRQAVTRWAKANGHKIVAWCVDEGVSGAKDAVDRPGLTEAITMLRNQQVDQVEVQHVLQGPSCNM